MVHNQYSKVIMIFRSESNGESLLLKFRAFLLSQRTLSDFSCPHAHQHNSVV